MMNPEPHSTAAGSIPSLASVMILRELDTTRATVEAYPDDASIWRSIPGITNVGGTLVLHMAGNLRHFIGSVIGKSAYVRDRDAEFSNRDLSRAQLLAVLDAARTEVERALAGVTDADLTSEYPLAIAGRVVGTSAFIIHLAAHLAYHLGQLDYHRRIVAGEGAKAVPSLQPGALPGRPA